VAAALGTTSGTAFWRRPFEFGAPTTLALAAAHGGLLLAGCQFSNLPPLAAAAACLAPGALALAGGRDHGAVLRLLAAFAAAAGLLGASFWLVVGR